MKKPYKIKVINLNTKYMLRVRKPSISNFQQMMSTFGKNPTESQKIVATTRKFGLGGMANQQGSAVNIYDTVNVATSANPQVLTFFDNTSNKVKTFTNWQQGEFKAGETLATKFIYVHIVQLLNASLTDNANTIINYFPVGKTKATSIVAYGNAEFKIANTTVFKEYQLLELLPTFNPGNQGLSAYDEAAELANPVIIGRSVIELDTVPVIIPNQAVKFTLQIPPITLPAGNFAVMVSLGRSGSIFAAKNTF
jgi:hypothetical protein